VSLLNENKINYTIVEYLKNPLGVDDVLLLSKKLGMDPGEFVRKNEKDFKENKLEKMIYDNNKMAESISKFPKIMERPILVKGDKAVIGRPTENILELLKK
jgi:arsenate reductase